MKTSSLASLLLHIFLSQFSLLHYFQSHLYITSFFVTCHPSNVSALSMLRATKQNKKRGETTAKGKKSKGQEKSLFVMTNVYMQLKLPSAYRHFTVIAGHSKLEKMASQKSV